MVYGQREHQARYPLEVEEGATVREAIERSGVLAEFPEIDLARNRVGIYGRLVTLESSLGEGDRVEILRPLTADPKDVRRRRVRR